MLHTIGHHNHFQGYSSVVLSIFTWLCDQYCHLVELKLCTHWTVTPLSSPCCTALSSQHSTFCICQSDSSGYLVYMRSDNMSFLCDWFVSLSKVHPRCSIWQDFFLTAEKIFPFICICSAFCLSIHLSTGPWRCFHFLAMVNSPAVSMRVKTSFEILL